MGRREGRVCLGRERVAIKNEQGKIPVKRKKKIVFLESVSEKEMYGS